MWDEESFKNTHQRLSKVEKAVDELHRNHKSLEKSLHENTALTQTIADNTSELVSLVKGVKGIRTLIVWVTPIVAGVLGLIAYFKGH